MRCKTLVLEMESVEKIKLIKGEVKAVTLETDKIYIFEKQGEKGLTLVEEELENMGFSFEYNSIKSQSVFCPLSLRVASLIATKKVFGWSDNQIKEMGRIAPKNSVFTKLVLRYLVSLKKMAKEIPRHWNRHYTVGSMDPGELHEDEKHFIIRLRDFYTYPIMCTYLSGYFIGTVELLGDFTNLTVEEVKCMYKGDDYHEFLIRWE
jgi:predicted hydrocarbon binding protein